MNTIADHPRWFIELQSRCEASSQNKVAKELDYTAGVISAVLKHKYTGKLDNVIARIYSVYLGDTVLCPVMGEIPKHHCQRYQQEPFISVNPLRRRRYRACRHGCPNSQIDAT